MSRTRNAPSFDTSSDCFSRAAAAIRARTRKSPAWAPARAAVVAEAAALLAGCMLADRVGADPSGHIRALGGLTALTADVIRSVCARVPGASAPTGSTMMLGSVAAELRNDVADLRLEALNRAHTLICFL